MTMTAVLKTSALIENTPVVAEVGDEELVIIKCGDEVFAMRNLCSHADYALDDGEVDPVLCTLECGAHGSAFDLTNGKPKNLPATRPVPVYPCRIDGDDVLVDVANPKNQEN